jgi:hypothetical protein
MTERCPCSPRLPERNDVLSAPDLHHDWNDVLSGNT